MKDEAKKLVDRFYKELTKNHAKRIFANILWFEEAKQCALIHVDKIIEVNKYYNAYADSPFLDDLSRDRIKYWQGVKQEIKKLCYETTNKGSNATNKR
jgi:hypothetical protein